MGPRTSLEIRKLVLAHFHNGKSHRNIAEMCCLSQSTVQNIIERFVKENRVADKGRKAPNKIFTAADERIIIWKITANPQLTATKLTLEIENEMGKKCSAETVRRILRNHNFIAQKKPCKRKKMADGQPPSNSSFRLEWTRSQQHTKAPSRRTVTSNKSASTRITRGRRQRN